MTDAPALQQPLPPDQPQEEKELRSTGYELFILLLSLVSVLNLLVDWMSYVIPITTLTLDVLRIINGILTIFFIFDFCLRFFTTSSKSRYFFRRWGWADLLACFPQLRIFRLFRVFRAVRLLRIFGVRNMVNEVVNNRAGVALYITVFSIIIIAEVVGVYILKAEASSPEANITTAGNAVWWILVTMTTVGYGDTYPVTAWGRILAVFVMLSGVALIGVLASFLSNFFLAPPPKSESAYDSDDPRVKLVELKELLEQQHTLQSALTDRINELEQMLTTPEQ